MSSMIQMPRPCVAEDEIVIARLDGQIAHGDRGKTASFELRPGFAAIDRNKQTELGPEEQQVRLNQIFLDDVRISAHTLELLRRHERSPGLAEIGGAKHVRRVVAKGVAIESGVSRARLEIARLHPADPRILRHARDVADDVGPGLAAVARDLDIAVIGADPDDRLIFRRFADRVDRGVHFRRRIVDGDAARLLLLLLLGIVRAQVRRDAIPASALDPASGREIARRYRSSLSRSARARSACSSSTAAFPCSWASAGCRAPHACGD